MASDDRTDEPALQQLLVAVGAARAATFEWWVDTGITRFGESCRQLLGYRPGDLPETIACWISLLHPDDREAVLGELIARLASGDDLLEMEFQLLRGDDEWRWYAARCRCLARAPDGSPRHLVGMLLDIDARKRAERAQLRLAELYALRGAVNQAVAHAVDRGQLFARVEQIAVELGGFARAACVLGEDRPDDARSFPSGRRGGSSARCAWSRRRPASSRRIG